MERSKEDAFRKVTRLRDVALSSDTGAAPYRETVYEVLSRARFSKVVVKYFVATNPPRPLFFPCQLRFLSRKHSLTL